MKLSDYALKELASIIIGDKGLVPYLSGPKIVDFFNSFGERDLYDIHNGGFPKLPDRDGNPSRTDFTFDRLKRINNTRKLKDAVEKIVNGNQSDELVKLIDKIINHEGLKLEKGDSEYFIVGHEEYKDEIIVEAKFEEIQSQILAELSKAKYQILIAVAWFTDIDIYNELLKRKNAGVNIQVIISDDEINTRFGVPLEGNFENHKIKKNGYDNMMHNKFCVIDLQTVISGSYNWSKKAQYNKENITVTKSRKLAEQFADNFIKLKLGED